MSDRCAYLHVALVSLSCMHSRFQSGIRSFQSRHIPSPAGNQQSAAAAASRDWKCGKQIDHHFYYLTSCGLTIDQLPITLQLTAALKRSSIAPLLK